MTQCANDTVCWWHCSLMTQCVDDTVCWWHSVLMTQCANDTVCWWHCSLMTQWVFTRGVSDQTRAFLDGFSEVVPLQWLQYFDERELEVISLLFLPYFARCVKFGDTWVLFLCVYGSGFPRLLESPGKILLQSLHIYRDHMSISSSEFWTANVHILLHAAFAAMDCTLNIVNKCRF